ncbi:MAG: hypothetical protein GX052_03935 [Syntrophomonadaceae bacterium]|jgi:hypothetical protein|nr:hypothetical protein [Syntrophomonadaceae bacterium]
MGLICEYPCRLDLFAEVVKAKNTQRQEKVLDEIICIPAEDVGGRITQIDDIKVQLISAEETFVGNHRVKVSLAFNLILIVVVGEDPGVFEIVTLEGFNFSKSITLDEFNPPLSPQEFKEEVERSQIILKNWSFEGEILGNCEDPNSPCFTVTPVPGTCILLKVFVDIIDKLTKFHDVVAFAELDPDDC